jgi:hypothetical protein
MVMFVEATLLSSQLEEHQDCKSVEFGRETYFVLLGVSIILAT